MPRKKRKVLPAPESTEIEPLNPGRCYFLELPVELRLQIYKDFFEIKDRLGWCVRPRDTYNTRRNQQYLSILRVSRQVHDEIWPVFASFCTFVYREPHMVSGSFSSVLSPRRLQSIKHLTLRMRLGSLLSIARDFQKIWWQHLDLFSNLDTLSLEVFDENKFPTAAIQKFYEMIEVIVFLMNQGVPKKPTWFGDGSSTPLDIRSVDLRGTHDWLLEISSAIRLQMIAGQDAGGPKLWDVREKAMLHRVVLRQNDIQARPRLKHMFQDWDQQPPFESNTHLGEYSGLRVQPNIYHLRSTGQPEERKYTISIVSLLGILQYATLRVDPHCRFTDIDSVSIDSQEEICSTTKFHIMGTWHNPKSESDALQTT